MNIRIPVSWLREYIKTDVNTKTLANYLSLCGPSVERIEKHQNEIVFDVEVTGNRPDAFSVFGLAREALAILNAQNEKAYLVHPKGLNLNLDPDTSHLLPLEINIKNKNLCPRFTAIVIDNVKIKPSPAFVKNRLKLSGIRPINNIVDISNIIMLELGQPMHTFDYDKILGHKMILRLSKDTEQLKTLDGKNRKLPTGSIVIQDHNRLVDLCGIMGGENSQISRRTKRVILFVQAYNPITIRKTTQALAFRTEAASRFEKGIDLDGILPALSRAVYLAKKFADAKIASELIDIYVKEKKPQPIVLKLFKLNQYLGIKIPGQKAVDILKSLGFEAKLTDETITAKPPSWRQEDVKKNVDLIEEVARIYGYWHLPSSLPSGEIPKSTQSDLAKAVELKKNLKYLGFTEVISYSIISKELYQLTQTSENKIVELSNPLTSQWQFMRPTLLVSLVSIIAQNQTLEKDLELYEIAKTYLKQKGDLPKQDLTLALVIPNANFYRIKGIAQNIFEILNLQTQWQRPDNGKNLFEPNQAAQITTAGKVIGTVGILSSKITDYFGIEEVAGLELNLTTAYGLPTQLKTYKPIPKYPPVIEDISAIFDENIQLEKIISLAKDSGSPLIKDIKVIDVFSDKKIGQGKRSVTLRLVYQKPSGTPTQEEVKNTREKIIAAIEKTLKAKIRK